MLDKTTKEAHSVDAAIPNRHNLHSTITERLQKYIDLKEELIIWQLRTAYTSLGDLSPLCSMYTNKE